MREIKLRVKVMWPASGRSSASRGALPLVGGVCWGVTAGKASHNASNARDVTAGKMGRNSSRAYNVRHDILLACVHGLIIKATYNVLRFTSL